MNKSFAKAVGEQKRKTDEVLQLYGDRPDISRRNACDEDWLHVISTHYVDLQEAARGKAPPDEELRGQREKDMRLALARIAAACEAWYVRVGKRE